MSVAQATRLVPPCHTLGGHWRRGWPGRPAPCTARHAAGTRAARWAAPRSAANANDAPPSSLVPLRTWAQHSWLWRGHRVRYISAGCGPPVVLVHGFGASSHHWRKNIDELTAAGYKVYAIDLLGQGGSEKPVLEYSMQLWSEQVQDFMTEFVQQPAVLVGNSIGSLACLMVAEAAPGQVAGLALLNCAGGMNNKATADDWRIKLALPIFWCLDMLLLQRTIAAMLFDSFRSRINIQNVLKSVYSNKEAVDEELVSLIFEPSCDEGALDAFVSILTGPPGPRPDVLLSTDIISQPLLVLWGSADPMTPADGPVGKFFQRLPERRPDTRFVFLQNVGHCPHDDRPDLVHSELLPWLEGVHLA